MLEFATSLARRAGEELLTRFRPLGRAEIVERKKEEVRNLVTAADHASEALLVEAIRREFPDHGIAAEEGSGTLERPEYVWHVDPLDGTVNYTHGHPFFAVSLGLVRNGDPILGVVHAPVLRETFAGERGRGATLNGTPIRVSDTVEVSEALLATGFPYDRNSSPDTNVDNFATLIMLCRGIRRAGAAALDLAYVAAGRLDGYWELSLSSWDIAAGAAILLAAGGTVTDFSGGSRYLDGGDIVAGNARIHEQIRNSLHPLRGPRR